MKHHRSRHAFARFALGTTLAAAAALVAAACSSSPAQPSSCTITIGQFIAAAPAAGVNGSVPVTAGSGCAWTATSAASFITITAGATGTGNGTVQYTVAPNTGATRTGTMTIAGATVTITQAGATTVVGTGALATPTPQSPTGGQVVDSLTPTLVINNAAAAGAVGPVIYRFEVSDADSFPDARTLVGDGIAQASGATTSWPVGRSLTPNTTYFWHARASSPSLTTGFSNTETFKTPNSCSFSLSATTISIPSNGGTATVNVSAPGTCTWTATSNAPFITITSGGSGTGDGTVAISVATGSGAGRSGTLTIAGQTVTVNQAASGVVAAFNLIDPATQSAPTTECQFRNTATPPQPTTCMLTSTSFTLGTLPVVSYSWMVQYTYVTVKVITGTSPQLSFTDICGQFSSTPDGVAQPLSVTLTVTDSAGNSATATSGAGSQPALSVRLFACGV